DLRAVAAAFVPSWAILDTAAARIGATTRRADPKTRRRHRTARRQTAHGRSHRRPRRHGWSGRRRRPPQSRPSGGHWDSRGRTAALGSNDHVHIGSLVFDLTALGAMRLVLTVLEGRALHHLAHDRLVFCLILVMSNTAASFPMGDVRHARRLMLASD